MIQIVIPGREIFLEQTNEFITYTSCKLKMEHSLKSIAKWEGETEKSFFDGEALTEKDFRLYVRCMTVNPPEDETIFELLSPKDYEKIALYMQRAMSGRQFYRPTNRKGKTRKRPGQSMTAEDVYYTMVQYGIPLECENWHFSRLMALIRTFQQKGGGGERMTPMQQARFWDELNNQRRAKMRSKG